jgi:hypothetical protein
MLNGGQVGEFDFCVCLAQGREANILCFAHAHPVIRQPPATFCSVSVMIEPVSFIGFPFCLTA